MEQPAVEFLDEADNVLAVLHLPDDLFVEGEPGSIKECDVRFHVTRSGRVTRYRSTLPNGEALYGAVIKQPLGNYVRDIMLERVDLRQGEVLEGKWQVISTKDRE